MSNFTVSMSQKQSLSAIFDALIPAVSGKKNFQTYWESKPSDENVADHTLQEIEV